MKIALLGGSFDPPHLAHIQVAAHLLKGGKYDEVWVMPTPKNPFKETSASFQDRLEMCQLAFAPFKDKVRVLSEERELTGYTIDLIKSLKGQYPKNDFTFIAGSDLRSEIAGWKDSEKLKKILSFEFLPRPPDPASPFF